MQVNKLISANRKHGIVTGMCGLGILHSDVTPLNNAQNQSIFRQRSGIKLARCDGNESMIGCTISKQSGFESGSPTCRH